MAILSKYSSFGLPPDADQHEQSTKGLSPVVNLGELGAKSALMTVEKCDGSPRQVPRIIGTSSTESSNATPVGILLRFLKAPRSRNFGSAPSVGHDPGDLVVIVARGATSALEGCSPAPEPAPVLHDHPWRRWQETLGSCGHLVAVVGEYARSGSEANHS